MMAYMNRKTEFDTHSSALLHCFAQSSSLSVSFLLLFLVWPREKKKKHTMEKITLFVLINVFISISRTLIEANI